MGISMTYLFRGQEMGRAYNRFLFVIRNTQESFDPAKPRVHLMHL